MTHPTKRAPATPAPVAPAPAAAPAPAPAPDAATPIPAETRYAALDLKGVKGGQFVFAVAGTVDQVLAMLVDFDHAQDNRAWAQTYKTVSRSDAEVVAEWKFKGKMGFQPTVHLAFRTERSDKGGVCKFELRKKSLGIASFFGDYRVTPLPGTPPRSQIAARTFIDSGIPFANASREDIEKGLREDARLIRLWMGKRTQQ